jgi:hypothetical protein
MADYELIPLKKGTLTIQAPEIEVTPSADYLLEAVKKPEYQFSAGKAIANIVPSGIQFAKDITEPIRRPVNTFENLMNLTTGALTKALPESLLKYARPEAVQAGQQALSGTGEYLSQRYGGGENILKTIESDPVGALGDLSTILTGGGALATRAAPLSRVGQTLTRAGTATNPLTPVQNVVSNVAPVVAGGFTRRTPETFQTAYQAGKEGGTALKSFTDSLRGKTPLTDVTYAVKSGAKAMQKDASDVYRAAKTTWSADPTPLDFTPVKDTILEGKKSVRSGGSLRNLAEVDRTELTKINRLDKLINQFDKSKYRNAQGFDSLKKRIGREMPNAQQYPNANRIYNEVLGSVNDELNKIGGYRDAMTSYGKTQNAIEEIKIALGSSNQQNIEAGLRKVLTLTKDVPTQEYKAAVAKQLKNATGIDIMPAVAGQALQEYVSPFVKQNILSGGAIGGVGAALNPASAAAIGSTVGTGILLGGLLSSPRLLGETSQLAGRVGRVLPAERLRALALGGNVANRLRSPQQGLIDIMPFNEEEL